MESGEHLKWQVQKEGKDKIMLNADSFINFG